MKLLKRLLIITCVAGVLVNNAWSDDYKIKITGDRFELDLSEITLDHNPNHNSSYNPETHVFKSGGNAGLGRWKEPVDASDFNSLVIKYKVKDGYSFGCIFLISYQEPNGDVKDITYYLPSYLTEVEIPLYQKAKNYIRGFCTFDWDKPAMKTEIQFESIAFEKKIVKEATHPNYCDLPPVIDNGPVKKFNDSISAVDLNEKLNPGVNLHCYFMPTPAEITFGLDLWTAWGQTEKLTKKHIIDLKKKGFNSLRVTVSWGAHLMDDDYTIDPRFILQVKEVVDWCIEEDMYVILDEDSSYYYPQDKDKYERYYKGYCLNPVYEKESTAFLKAIWTQIAAAFNNSYDEHLVFEFLNEPHYDTYDNHFNEMNGPEIFNVLNNLNQVIMDTIRKSGCNNAKRFCAVESIGGFNFNLINENFKLPHDSAKGKLLACYHSYPMIGSNENYCSQILLESRKKEELNDIAVMRKKFIDKGIPVLISEFATNQDAPVYERLKCIGEIASSFYEDKGFSVIGTAYSPLSYDFTNYKWFEKDKLCFDYLLALSNKEKINYTEDDILKKYPLEKTKANINLLTEPLICYEDWPGKWFDKGELGYLTDKAVLVITVEPIGSGYHWMSISSYDSVAKDNEGLKFEEKDIKGGKIVSWGDIKARTVNNTTVISYTLNTKNINAIYESGVSILGENVKITSFVVK